MVPFLQSCSDGHVIDDDRMLVIGTPIVPVQVYVAACSTHAQIEQLKAVFIGPPSSARMILAATLKSLGKSCQTERDDDLSLCNCAKDVVPLSLSTHGVDRLRSLAYIKIHVVHD